MSDLVGNPEDKFCHGVTYYIFREVPEGVHISRSLPEAVDLLTTDTLRDQIENIHVIGGSSVYQVEYCFNCKFT